MEPQEALDNKVFEVKVLSGDTFLTPTGVNGSSSAANGDVLESSHDGPFTGKVTCSVPVNVAGKELVAVGCAKGVWIGFRHDPKSMRRVLLLKMVSRCAMLEDYGIFLVLANKQLFAYQIEALVPSSYPPANISQPVKKLNGTQDVQFFTVGTLLGRTLVIYKCKRGLDSIFYALEPASQKISELSPKYAWFKIYKDFFVPYESYDLTFLTAKIAILGSKGFEIMDLNDFETVTIPQRDESQLGYLAKRCEECRPIGIFESAEDEFLLCYNEFGVYVDKHGDPIRAEGIIEWEGNAERFAIHSRYILLFDSRFIEIRSLETGRLAQIIPGSDIRCISDGRRVSSLSALQAAQVHAVMNVQEIVGGPEPRAIVQQVIEFLPTVP
ncbi:hypothetical protein GYMLUDRAFT_247374 [Collybiopsis luxurians FD-317 M1]|uniref:CNH domain-containing protein n=1 Tax=Collybiopsis luxurians FD-317 M1 TaxID=944289 RepID=A0A0D0BPW7_9AGAR|nr:hypothetical protein GYMLUDRAFT_247374 [Collybiopsis luxurians FD-317 M1]